VAPLVVVGAVVLGALLLGAAAKAQPGAGVPPPPPTPPPRIEGLTFATRNLNAVHALVSALLADPNLTAGTLNIYAAQFELYGFVDEANELRQKALVAPKYTQQEIQSGAAELWEQQSKQGFW